MREREREHLAVDDVRDIEHLRDLAQAGADFVESSRDQCVLKEDKLKLVAALHERDPARIALEWVARGERQTILDSARGVVSEFNLRHPAIAPDRMLLVVYENDRNFTEKNLGSQHFDHGEPRVVVLDLADPPELSTGRRAMLRPWGDPDQNAVTVGRIRGMAREQWGDFRALQRAWDAADARKDVLAAKVCAHVWDVYEGLRRLQDDVRAQRKGGLDA